MMLKAAVMVAAVAVAANGQQFGHSMLKHWDMPDGFVNTNFGAQGLVPNVVMEDKFRWASQISKCPDCNDMMAPLTEYNEMVTGVADFLNVTQTLVTANLAFIQSSSDGITAIVRSVVREQYIKCRDGTTDRCSVLYFSTAYPMLNNVMIEMEHEFGNGGFMKFLKVEIQADWLTDADKLIGGLRSFLDVNDPNRHVFFTCFSHVVAFPGILLDAKRLTRFFHERDALVALDGAHALGSFKLDLSDIGCDYWTGSAHKWWYSPPGTAILYVRFGLHNTVVSNIIAWIGLPRTTAIPYGLKFLSKGSYDQSGMLSMKRATQFRKEVLGGDALFEHMRVISRQAANFLMQLWGTDELEHQVPGFYAMINIRVPAGTNMQSTLSSALMTPSADGRYTFGKFVTWDGKLYMRLSIQAYNELSDYEWVGRRVLEVLANAKKQ